MSELEYEITAVFDNGGTETIIVTGTNKFVILMSAKSYFIRKYANDNISNCKTDFGMHGLQNGLKRMIWKQISI